MKVLDKCMMLFNCFVVTVVVVVGSNSSNCDRRSLRRFSWSRTYYVDWAGFELTELCSFLLQ